MTVEIDRQLPLGDQADGGHMGRHPGVAPRVGAVVGERFGFVDLPDIVVSAVPCEEMFRG
jgi:hypothetical protein